MAVEESKISEYTAENLFYPWFYMGGMIDQITNAVMDMSGYMTPFKNELLRLYRDMSMEIEKNTLVFFNIGAGCSPIYYSKEELKKCGMRQLPIFIVVAECPKKTIFMVDKFNEEVPAFVKYYKDWWDINFEKRGAGLWVFAGNEYITGVVEVRIYNTFFPTFLPINKEKLRDKKIEAEITSRQNASKDRAFVVSFYKRMKDLLERVGSAKGMTLVLSTASFDLSETTSTTAKLGTGNLDLELYKEIREFIEMPHTLFLVWPFESIYFFFVGTLCRFDYTKSDYSVTLVIKVIGDEVVAQCDTSACFSTDISGKRKKICKAKNNKRFITGSMIRRVARNK